MKKTPLDAAAVPAERPAPAPRAEPAPEDEVEEVAAPRAKGVVWNPERKIMLLTGYVDGHQPLHDLPQPGWSRLSLLRPAPPAPRTMSSPSTNRYAKPHTLRLTTFALSDPPRPL